MLAAKNFTLEIAYALEAADPGGYSVTHTLHNLSSGELVERPEFDDLFARMFEGMVFGLTKGARGVHY